MEIHERYSIEKSMNEDRIIFIQTDHNTITFLDDARRVSKELGITLIKDEQGVVSCSFPNYVIDNYIPRLTRMGLKVTICPEYSN